LSVTATQGDTWVLVGANSTALSPTGPRPQPTAGLILAPPTLHPGDILVADGNAFGGNGGIIRVDPVTGEQAPVAVGGNFLDPSGIAVGEQGQLYITDVSAFGSSGGVIQVDSLTGAQTPLSAGARFIDPVSIAIAADGTF